MRAELISVGTELLTGHVINTNAPEIAQLLAPLGIGVYHQEVVGDNPDRLRSTLATAIKRCDLVIATGGLGPTDDDITRETLAQLLDLPLQRDESWEEAIRQRVERYRRNNPETTAVSMTNNNLRQALIPRGATLLPNNNGTAPGVWIQHEKCIIILIPGPPREMRGLMHDHVIPRLTQELAHRGAQATLVFRTLKVVGLGESRVAEMLDSLFKNQSNPTIAPFAGDGEVLIRLTAWGRSTQDAEERNASVADTIYQTLGSAVYGENNQTLEEVVGLMLQDRNMTIAVAESCTGGYLGERFTRIAGSSRWFHGGVIAYTNKIKQTLLGVHSETLMRDGAVSPATAREMAAGVQSRFAVSLGVSITGVAGPEGGTEQKPVGTTCIAVIGPIATGDEQTVETKTRTKTGTEEHIVEQVFAFLGDREANRWSATQKALLMIREYLLTQFPLTTGKSSGTMGND
jgi:nicotinamide-nucleotide amidase